MVFQRVVELNLKTDSNVSKDLMHVHLSCYNEVMIVKSFQ